MIMRYRFRKPELIPTLFIVCVVTLMFALGIWQLERLQWKTALLAQIDAAQSEAPRDLLSYDAANLPAAAQWHNVTVTGQFLHSKEMYATPRYLHEQMGYAILTPLKVVTAQGPVYVLINRGWVPNALKEPESRAAGNPQGEVTVEGVIRGGFKKGLFVPQNQPERNLWFWYDLPAMAQTSGLPLMPVLIDATAVKLEDGSRLNEGPIPFPIEINIRNDHLGYAVTWFLIGITGIVMFGLYYLEKRPEAQN